MAQAGKKQTADSDKMWKWSKEGKVEFAAFSKHKNNATTLFISNSWQLYIS